jgi:hypothetical protein
MKQSQQLDLGLVKSKLEQNIHEVTLINGCKKLISGVHIFGKI